MKKILAIAVLVLFSCERTPKTVSVQPKQPEPALAAGPDTLAYTYNDEDHNATEEHTYIDTSKPITTISVKPNMKAGAPFNKLDYDNVVAYDYEGTYANSESFGSEIVNKENKLHPAVIKRQALTQQQADYVTNLLTDFNTYGGDIYSCFEPHLGLVFYKGKKVVLHISICLSCNHQHSSLPIPANEPPKEGFSKVGVKKIMDFEKELGF